MGANLIALSVVLLLATSAAPCVEAPGTWLSRTAVLCAALAAYAVAEAVL